MGKLEPEFAGKSVKEQAQQVLKRDYLGSKIVCCFNPACGKVEENTKGGKFMQCPCRTTYYCSKECQVSAPCVEFFVSLYSVVAFSELLFSISQIMMIPIYRAHTGKNTRFHAHGKSPKRSQSSSITVV
jgi:hypothetical protein